MLKNCHREKVKFVEKTDFLDGTKQSRKRRSHGLVTASFCFISVGFNTCAVKSGLELQKLSQ